MVAAPNRPPRAPAVALALVLLLPAATLLVPTASAVHGVEPPTVALTTDASSYVLGNSILFTATVTKWSGTCVGTSTAPSITRVVLEEPSARRIGHAAAALSFQKGSQDTTWTLTLPVNPPLADELPFNNAAAPFVATATQTCGADGDLAGSSSSSFSVTIDNVGPAGPVTFGFTSGAGTYGITLAGLSDINAAKADLTAIGGGQEVALSVIGTPQQQAIVDPTVPGGRVKVTLSDPRNVPAEFFSPYGIGSSLQVFPLADGKVHVRFDKPTGAALDTTYGFAIERPSAGVNWEKQSSTDTSVVTDVSEGGLVKDFILSASLFTQGQPNLLRVWQRTDGSDGVPSSAVPITPSASPNSLSLDVPPVGAKKNIGTLSGASSAASGAAQVRVALQRASDNLWWQNDSPATFGASPAWYVAARDAATGAWVTDAFDAGGSNAALLADLPDGAYRVVVQLASPDGVKLFEPSPFPVTLDRVAPTKHAPTQLTTVIPTEGIHQGSPLRVQLNVSDATSSLKNVSFQLRQTAAPNARVMGVDDVLTQVECGASCLVDGAYGQPSLMGNASFTFANAPVGSYQLVFLAYDAAGNQLGPEVLTSAVKIVPAVQARWPELRGDSIFVDLLAAYVSGSSLQPSENCQPTYVCKVSQITVSGRNGGSGDGQVLATLVAPRSQMTNEGGRWWWNYTLDSGLGSGSLNKAQPIQVRATAAVQVGSGDPVLAHTPWLPVATPSHPGGLQFAYPATDWVTNSTGTARFRLVLTLDSPSSEPYLKGTIKRLDATAADIDVPREYAQTSGGARPKSVYNYTISVPSLPDGQYAFEARIYTNESEPLSNVLASATRFFAVEKDGPVVAIANVTQPHVFVRNDNWVASQFQLHTYIDPGFANVTSSGFEFKLQRNVRGTGKTVLANSEEGFLVQVHNPQDLNPIDKDAVVILNVTLPTGALDGDVFTLQVGVKSDVTEPVPSGMTWGNVTNVTYPFRLDLSAPAAGVLFPETNATAISPTTELQIKGFATDAGAGVREVQVRLVNLSSNTTFHWRNSLANPGIDRDFWATTMPVLMSDGFYVRDVAVLTNATTTATHTMIWGLKELDRPRRNAADQDLGTDYPRIPLDRGSRYRVDIRATDYFGRTSEYSTEVGLDPEGPKILSAITADPGPYAWHGWANMSVQVSDNWCVGRVSLMAKTDAGAIVGPADFARPVNTSCRQADATSVQTWTINLRNHPGMTDQITNYTYWVEVMDAAGNVTETPLAQRTLKRAVVDTNPAVVKFLRLEPPLIGPGARSRVVAEVFEVGGMDRVRVFFHRINDDNTYSLLGEGLARPLNVAANGTGEWVAETDTDLGISNLTLGDYLWEVRPMDKSWETTCVTDGLIQCDQAAIILRVVSDAGIHITTEAPAAGVTFVNATPTFRWLVYDDELTASGITLRAGDAADNLTVVAPTTVTDMPLAGTTRVGLVVEYRPNLTSETFAIQLQATSQGISNETSVRTFTVDALAPVVQANVTGTVEVGNTSYAVSATRVALNATDENPVTITFSVNGGAFQAYTAPITPAGPDGNWRLDYAAADAAGNVARGSLVLSIDRGEPAITVAKHGDEVVVTVTDDGVGVNESSVRAFYAYGDALTFSPTTMQKLTGNSYRAQLPGNATATGLRYYFEAKDLLGNTGQRFSAASPYEIAPEGPPENLAPTLQITSPAPNSAARQRVELRWLAEDPEGEELTITIAIRSPPTGQGRILQTAGPNNGSFVVDLTGEPAGTHTLLVTASDGEKTAQESVSFVVERGQVVELITPPPVQVQQGANLPFAVRINTVGKEVATVTYALRLENETVEEGSMVASQGAYTVQVKPVDAGKYALLVTVAYADGTTEPQRQVATFEVAASEPPATGGGMPASLLTLVVLALVTVALAAYGAFVRWGR